MDSFSAEFTNDLINPVNMTILPGIGRILSLLQLLDNPQNRCQVIHITGTNGKGSTAAFIATGLIHAGFRVGKFTSPYIYSIHECICLNNQPITTLELENIYFKIKQLLIKHNLYLSPFEFLTAIMFEYFASQNLDYLILEVGMGGATDATNVVDSKFSIITNVALEHTKWLGNTITAIAEQKAGIIKNGITIIATNHPEVIKVVSAKTRNYINVLDYYTPEVVLDCMQFKTILRFTDPTGSDNRLHQYDINLFGKFQAYNFLCAYQVFTSLKLPQASIIYAAENTHWAGRLQVIARNPLIILDATHNPAGAQSICESLDKLWAKDQVVIISSILSDKDIKPMLISFSHLSDYMIYTTIDNTPRGLTAHDLAQYGNGLFNNSKCVDNPQEALIFAKTLGRKVILITGSLYLLSYYYS